MVLTSEHSLNVSEYTATIPDVTRRLSLEAFNGSPIKILNSKNLPLPDVEGTRGMYTSNYVNSCLSRPLVHASDVGN